MCIITLFEAVLGDNPKKWLQNFQDREAAAHRRVTLQRVFDEFVMTYHGGVSEKLAEQQLNALVYGKGECKDLVTLDNEFDRLALELYPGLGDLEGGYLSSRSYLCGGHS